MNPNLITDHDILIDLQAQVRELRNDLKMMNDGGQKIIADHEMRIRVIEKYMWLAIGALYLINAALTIYLVIHR